MNYQQVQLITKRYWDGTHPHTHNGAQQQNAFGHLRIFSYINCNMTQRGSRGGFCVNNNPNCTQDWQRVTHTQPVVQNRKDTGGSSLSGDASVLKPAWAPKLHVTKAGHGSKGERVARQKRCQHKDELLSVPARLTHRHPRLLGGTGGRRPTLVNLWCRSGSLAVKSQSYFFFLCIVMAV